jgi:hypothetical protein
MMEIENLEFTATSNPAGGEAEKTFLASVDSMLIMQKAQNEISQDEPSQSLQHRSGASQAIMTRSQQHDTRGVQPLQDDTSVLSFQDSIAMQTVQSYMESVKSEVDALRAHIISLESGQIAILAALNGLQNPSGSVQTSARTEPSSLTDESGGPRTTGHG